MHPLLSPLSVCTRVKGLVRSPCLRSFHAASSNITYPVKLCVIPQDCRRKLPWSQNYETNINRSISSQSIRDSMSNLVKEYFGPETLFVNSAMKSLMYCHDLTGLPWWTTICVVTVGLKTLLVFPLSVHGRKVNAKLVLMNEKMLKILPELEREVHIEAVRKGWTQEEAKMVFHVNKKKIVREHYIKENCHPMKGFASLLTQLPLWLSVSFALRHLSGSFYWASKTEASKYVAIDMQNEGVLWFTSLFQPDPFYILPVILLSTNLAIGVINLYELRKMKRGNLAKILTGMMMFYSVAIFSISILMPSCITFYWSTSAICSLVQLLLLNNLKVQKALGIPDVRHLMLKKIKKTSNILDGQTKVGGASPHTGGRDEKPPQFSGSSAQALSASRWVPPSTLRRDGPSHDERTDFTFRRVRGILNKLTPEKFDKLSLELLNVGIESQVILRGIILLIFEKALDEPKYSSMYAQLCHQLCEDAPNFEQPSSNITTFRRLLLNKCQDEFENRSKATDVFDRRDSPLTPDEAEQYHIAKQKMLGNIKFIGELGKLEMLHEGILHKCIKQLLEKKKNIAMEDMAEDLECLCYLMRTVGRRLDTNKAKSWMDQYFARMRSFANREELPSRIRFMLQDVQELRNNNWKPRHINRENGPRTITEIRKEAADEEGEYYPMPQQNRMYGGRQMNGNMQGWMSGQQGNMGDLFGMSGPGMMMGSIGTGPGVINDMPGYLGGKQRMMQQQGQGFNKFNNQQRDPGMQRRQNGGSPTMGRHSPQNQQQFQPPHNNAPRDLPPRFVKLAQQQQSQTAPPGAMNGTAVVIVPPNEEISLRPAKNFNVFKPNSPSNLPRSTHPTAPPVGSMRMTAAPDPPKPLLNKQPQITIKQVESKEKPKSNKKFTPSKDEAQKIVENLLTDYLANGETNEALTAFKDMYAPKKYIPELLMKMMKMTVEKTDDDREKMMTLISAMKADNLITSDQTMEALQSVFEQMGDMEAEFPLIRSYVSTFAAMSITGQVVTLNELAEPLENGAYYPLFLISLQQMHKIKGKDWLANLFNESKLDLLKMLPEIDQRKERMMEILEDRGLSFLFPLLRVQSELWKEMQTEPSATALFKWIKEHVNTDLQYTSGFLNILTTSLMKYVTQDSTLGDDVDITVAPEKTLIDKEKQNLEKMKGVLQMFLHEHVDLQIAALYAAQVFCYSHEFPKGMLLRFFMNLYDMEVVEEEAFLKWKEEVNDQYPGKGKALFQVNQWLTWLEQAEEESDEDED
ncbi:eukaryotic translation initiation factor 4 gamma 2-like [Saccostrea echinata]|uniref:eukaryotic translation initiation factor 4 gamma 2-like n=1 Tax=Saccostrea echinata TaxID=191078 RepID=UPI002A818180|nr:eukaryotic translation initiation factor 4 gamma 2-like [Saccostrea echinata]